MLTGQIRNDIDKLWEKFWTGGITNPLTVVEQISYLMFARMLDMQEELAERKANRTGKDFQGLFPKTPEGQLLRWKNFKQMSGAELHKHLKNNVYPHFSKLGQTAEELGEQENNATKLALGNISEYMQDADLDIKNETVLSAAVDMVDALDLNKSDTKGDIYEYLLSKLSTAGINGQFRTPRHIIDMMIAMLDPEATDVICDPACGTAGFLARTVEFLNKKYTSPDGLLSDEEGHQIHSGDLLEPYRQHINHNMFWGFDFDSTMLKVSSMNMALHGITHAHINYQDTLNKSVQQHYPHQQENFFDLVLANPPFKGSLDESNTNPAILNMVKTKKTELLFVAQILRMLKLGGRAAVVVPDGVLFGSSKAHQKLRETLVEHNQLEGVISLPSGVFKPYAGVSTAIIIFTKGGTTDKVWFYNLQADGYSLDDKRAPIDENDIPDCQNQWQNYQQCLAENDTGRLETEFADKTQKAFLVDKAEITSNKYDLSINRYKETTYIEEEFDRPVEILERLKKLESEIMNDFKELEGML